jgi:kynurenine formamidase
MPNGAVVVVRKERAVVRRFREAGATSVERAKSLTEIGVSRGVGLRRLRERGVIREGSAEVYYLDERGWASLSRQRRRGAFVVVGIVAGLVVIGLLIARLAAQGPTGRIVDLGHAISATDPSWEGTPAFERSVVATFEKDGYAAGKITVEEHFGTHLDAPAHFSKTGWTVDRIPVDRLYRPGVCVNVATQAAKDADYLVTRADLKAFETRSGAIPEGSVALIATGWDRFWPDRGRYMNEKDGTKHFPGLSADAVTYLAKERRVAGIGIDTPSIDNGPSATFEAHKVSMALNVYHIENAAHLTTLPASGFTVVVAPIDIAGGSGGPTRVFALLK